MSFRFYLIINLKINDDNSSLIIQKRLACRNSFYILHIV